MYFKASGRINPGTKKYDSYYRLVESYRNETGRICHRTILNVGFVDSELTPEQLNTIARTLTEMYQDEKLKELLTALSIKNRPFTKLKSVVHRPKLKRLEIPIIRALPAG